MSFLFFFIIGIHATFNDSNFRDNPFLDWNSITVQDVVECFCLHSNLIHEDFINERYVFIIVHSFIIYWWRYNFIYTLLTLLLSLTLFRLPSWRESGTVLARLSDLLGYDGADARNRKWLYDQFRRNAHDLHAELSRHRTVMARYAYFSGYFLAESCVRPRLKKIQISLP